MHFTNLPELFTFGITESVNISLSGLKAALVRRTRSANCSRWASSFSSILVDPNTFLIPFQTEPKVPWIFFGFVSGNSQAKSRPSNPYTRRKLYAEFTNEVRASAASS